MIPEEHSANGDMVGCENHYRQLQPHVTKIYMWVLLRCSLAKFMELLVGVKITAGQWT